MELPWFDGLDDAALEAMLCSLEGGEGDGSPAAAARDSPPDADLTVSVNPLAPLQVQLRFARGESNADRKTKAAPMPETRGSRKRRELQQLRDEVEELQSTLAELNDDMRQNGEQWMDKVVGSAWETMVASQRSQLRRAQAENRKLRRAIEENDTLIDQLRRLVKQHEARMAARGLHAMDPPHRLSSQRLAILDSLTEVLTPMFLRTDAVLSDPGLAKLTPHFTSVNVELVPDSLAIQRIDSRIVPFDLQTTTDAVWRNQLDRVSSRSRIEWERLPDETYRSCFVSYMRIAGFDGHATCYMALRRIVESDRIILLRSAIIMFMEGDTSESSTVLSVDAGAKRILVRDSPVRNFLWNVVSRPSHVQLHGACDPPELTQIQTCSISLPNVAGQSEAEMAASSELYSEIAEQMYLRSEEKLDNLLLGTVPPEAQALRFVVASC